MVRNYDITQFMMLKVPRSMRYKYHLRIGSESKAKKYVIPYNACISQSNASYLIMHVLASSMGNLL